MPRFAVLLPVVIAFLVGALPALAWTWPVDGPVLQQFTFGEDPYAGGQHRGIDIGALPGTPVLAPSGGTVSFAGVVPGGGRTITIRTDGGHAVTLQQLGAIGVSEGAAIAEGQAVATVGTGDSGAASHLHLGIRVAADPNGYVDPLSLLPPRSPSNPAPPPESGDQPENAAPETASSSDSSPAAPAPAPADPAPSAGSPDSSSPAAGVVTVAEVDPPVVATDASELEGDAIDASPGGSVVTLTAAPERAPDVVAPRSGSVASSWKPRASSAPAFSVPAHRSEPGPIRADRQPARGRSAEPAGPRAGGRVERKGADQRAHVGLGATLDAPGDSSGELVVAGVAGAVALVLIVLAWRWRPAGRTARGTPSEPDPRAVRSAHVGFGPESPHVGDGTRRSARGGPRAASGGGRSRRRRARASRPYDGPL